MKIEKTARLHPANGAPSMHRRQFLAAASACAASVAPASALLTANDTSEERKGDGGDFCGVRIV